MKDIYDMKYPLSNNKEEIENLCDKLSIKSEAFSNYENYDISILFHGVPIKLNSGDTMLESFLSGMSSLNYYPTHYYCYKIINEKVRGRKFHWTTIEDYLNNFNWVTIDDVKYLNTYNNISKIKFIFRIEFIK